MNTVPNQDNMPSSNAVLLINFSAMPWESPATGVRVKQVDRGNQRIRLIEFSENFVETDWCRTGHIGYVIDGKLEIDFGSHIVELSAGDGLFISPGESSKHKARVPRGKATLYVIEQQVCDASQAHYSAT
ncbi:MAG: hypothetical protein O3B13_16740 [Planctomycetota bacterium]|nr:hypothetical protein [Planctomycetota bacterium]MDA1164741.1 hypothetical protein [Planctomycetota bacterium]